MELTFVFYIRYSPVWICSSFSAAPSKYQHFNERNELLILKFGMIETQFDTFAINSLCIYRNLLCQIFQHALWKFCFSLRPEKLFTMLTFMEISTVEVYIHYTYTESDT